LTVFEFVYIIGDAMKLVAIFVTVSILLTGCGTVGGAISGAGKDLSRAGEWIGSK
jgi:predicted small secreted protein